MSNIDKQALRDSAESTINILENIAGFEPSDIEGDTVELRFETEGGFDTGCDVSIVDQCQKAADLVRALLDELEAAEKRIAELEAREVKLPPTIWYDFDGESQEIAVLEKSLVKKALSEAGVKFAAAAGKGE
ncbi:TPA: ead/Ea22-like family protein [Enterobacter hormaechei]|nr:ead/Ea22-like family protein [Enterobacter hormaechei]